MSVNDKGIVDTLKECPENGFRMLMMKYQEPVYWHIRRLVVSPSHCSLNKPIISVFPSNCPVGRKYAKNER